MTEQMPRVQISCKWVNIFTMQVCAVSDATDEEILSVCNRENAAGTENGWSIVIREPNGSLGQEDNKAPVTCADHPWRTHFLVLC